MTGIYNNNGSIATTTVTGSVYTGFYAADGSVNVVLDDSSHTGVYHPCGAIRVNSGTGTTYYDASGAVYSNHLLGPGFSASAPVTYTGQVATRTYLPDFSNTTNKQMRGRSAHIAMDTITAPTLRFPNFYVDGFGGGATYAELGLGAASTITASIEYPLGTFTQVLFSGVSTGTIPNLSYLDGTCTVNIMKGDVFYVRYFINNTAGIVFCLGESAPSVNVPGNYQFGDVLDSAVSGLTDNTLGGAYTTTSGASRYSPIVIAGTTALPSVLVIGDSKSYGENDIGDGSGNVGEIQRWLSPYFANANWGIRGRDAGQFVANSTVQIAAAGTFFTHLINENGVNGFIHGESAATVATNNDALANLFPTLKKYIVTILPVATTTDNYATLVNQTTAAYNAGRVTENTRRRTIPAPWLGCFDSAAAVESSLNSGLVTPALGYFNSTTSVHPAPAGYVAIAEQNRNLLSVIGTPPATASINYTDSAVDATSQSTYTWSAKNFLIGTPNAARKVVVGISSRFGTTGATLTSVTIGGVAAIKRGEIIDTTGGAESITSVWEAIVPTGTNATVSAVFSTAMLRAGISVWTVYGTFSTASNASTAGLTLTNTAVTPSKGGAIIFTSIIAGSVPTLASTGYVQRQGVTLIAGTMYYASGSSMFQGSQTYTNTYSTGNPTTGVVVTYGP